MRIILCNWFHYKNITFCSVILHNILRHIDSNKRGGILSKCMYAKKSTTTCEGGWGLKNIDFYAYILCE